MVVQLKPQHIKIFLFCSCVYEIVCALSLLTFCSSLVFYWGPFISDCTTPNTPDMTQVVLSLLRYIQFPGEMLGHDGGSRSDGSSLWAEGSFEPRIPPVAPASTLN